MWDERFAEEGFAYETEPNDFLKAQVQRLPKGGKILCVAEGEGRNALFLLKQGFEVTAIDLSLVGAAKAKKRAVENGFDLDYRIAHLKDFDYGFKQWDGVVSIFCHPPVVWRSTFHQLVSRSIKPNGVLLVEGYSKAQLKFKTGGPKDVSQLFEVEEFKRDFSDYNHLHLTGIEREIHEGKYHKGLSSVIQFVAVKR